MTNGTQWRSWFINDRWFRDLPALLQDSLLSSMRQRRVTPGKSIFQRGAPAPGLYALLTGSLRINPLKPQQGDMPPAEGYRPFWFGEASLFDDLPATHDVFAQDAVILLHMPHAPLKQLLAEHPAFWRHFRDLLGRKLGLAVPAIEDITLMPTEERVAFRLLMLAEAYGEMDRSVRSVPLADMASNRCLGLSGEVVERVLGQLAERQIVCRDHALIGVLDIEWLREAALHRLTGACG
ncbi:Crp/Fnr family transcriptional regulator [Pseudomonas syringae]